MTAAVHHLRKKLSIPAAVGFFFMLRNLAELNCLVGGLSFVINRVVSVFVRNPSGRSFDNHLVAFSTTF